MYPFDNQLLLANEMSSLSLKENSVKPGISYYAGPFIHKQVAMMAVPPAHYQLINTDHIKVDGVGRPLVKGTQIRVHNCPAIHDYLKQFSGAAGNVLACPSIQKPLNLHERVYARSSQLVHDGCFLVQSRSACGRGKNLRCLSFAKICERKANLSLSQMETVNIPRSNSAEPSMSKMIKAGQIKSPLERHEFNPHPYDDIASRNIYLSTHSSFLQRQPCWNTSTPVPEIAKQPDQQLVKKIKRRRLKRKRRNRNDSDELFLDNGKPNTLKTHSVQHLMNILTSLSLDQAPRPPREQRSKQKTANANALVAWKNDPPAKLSGLCGWIGQSKNITSHCQPFPPSPPRGPRRRRFRKSRRAKKLRVKGHGISPIPEMPSQI